MNSLLAFDILLAALLLWLAWQSMFAASLFRAVISFMIFGLLMALTWVRLDAPDIALAEAAIGAGITGALLLSALGRLPRKRAGNLRHRHGLPGLFWILFGLSMSLAAWLLWHLGPQQPPAPGLGELVALSLPDTGVNNPVTAVLLSYRAFDTLLEIGVLLLGTLAIWSLGPSPWSTGPVMPSPALPSLARALFPAFVLISVYLLWRGSHAAGGAFPAGAVMGAGGVLMLLAGATPWLTSEERGPWRWILLLGLGMMLTVASASPLLGYAFFQYPPAWSARIILMMEVAAALSIALLLFALYLGGQPPARWRDGGRP
ncbi:hydrogenase subunit MbhD domain-containing protein [Thioalkalivibrio sulfidiphilus]|uniref:hydrogenase subunit MbhD domain-containing protein n=1 Tax=Thioalkalivibrio sulfidiphilus TaxID=1033854 RepID=UPI00035D6453|nr:hydrogenase subunit MbhD domain-containing protein [Thioalkalivibrio sulfidiphilus]